MKRVAFWEYAPEDASIVIEKIKKPEPANAIKTLFPSHYLCMHTGVWSYEEV